MENKKENILSMLGIDIADEKIDIDLNKTKSFFESLQSTLEKKSEDLSQNIKDGKVDLQDSVGIKVDDEHISLDLKKTKSFFENLTNKVESFVKDLDSTFSEFKSDDSKEDKAKREDNTKS